MNYRDTIMKTDTQTQQDVLAELKWQPSIHAAEIGVAVKDGVVTLSGEVSSYAEKCEVERAVQRVSGVNAVAIEIDVKLTEFGKRTNADIARSAENALEMTNSIPADTLKVTVEGGWVTLTGTLNWQYQKQVAADALRHLVGVTGISNEIVIESKATLGNVKADIEAALKRRANADAQQISVAVEGADVTLTGEVHSWSERDLAMHAAWSASGVHSVLDRMTLVH
jgi:osmotically-inducible protein OsmY